MTRMPAGKTLWIILYTTVCILAALIVSAHADTRYVSDMLIISVRDAQRHDANVLGYIKTPTAVDVLGEQGDYLKIKTKDGLEGWVLAKYIVTEKPKALIIEDLKNQIEELTKEVDTAEPKQNTLSDASSETTGNDEKKIRELKEAVDKNQKLADKAGRDFAALDKKYKTLLLHSGNTDQLLKEMNRLKKTNTQLNAEITTLRKNTGNPLKSRKVQLFIAGAGVLLIGIILGGSAKKKKRYKLT
ncbi:MAG: TIGR04211 family SH3 domain-containing protein [Desulfobacterales bacterium]|nr:TIGR04211 family SH3 domain-containing protein [Desulfobacterales bacterium]